MFFDCPVPVRKRDCIVLAHGSGGQLGADLVERVILPAFRNPALEPLDDQAILAAQDGRLAFTTDSFVVTPLFFPGGDIGELAVNGTVNDLAMGGARPIALSLAFILEEGLSMDEFRRVVKSVRSAAMRAEVAVVTGDTKVVGAGSADKIFVNTSGIGIVPSGCSLGSVHVRPGDAVLVSGAIGNHGITVLAQRQGVRLGDLSSDTAPLYGLVRSLLDGCPGVHALRDPTRGGLACVLSEIATRRKLGIHVDEAAVPIDEAVRDGCELFGVDPFYSANEGKIVAFVPEPLADSALEALRAHSLGRRAARIGRVTDDHPGVVLVRSSGGGERVLELPLSEPLPRVC
jgi:hydrogenase expression/formation protein HypE